MDSGSGSSEDKDGQHDALLAFPESMLSALDDVAPGLDSADFECVAYVNGLFPTEQSLAGLEAAAAKCEYGAQNAEKALAGLVRGAGSRRASGAQALVAASEGATRLASRLKTAEARAARSANTVRDVTAEIKALDAAKTNLAVAITALHHCRLLADAAAALPSLAAARNYKELVMPLQACSQVLQQFETYQDIPLIRSLRDEVERVRSELGPQILDDCKKALANGGEWRALGDACSAAEAVGIGQELLNELLRMELMEYTVLFAANEEEAQLERVERRYAWLKRRLLAFEQGRARVLPASWDASRALALAFCADTRRGVAEVLAAHARDLDVRSLLHAVTKTHAFELLLHRRFDGEIPPNAAVIPASTAEEDIADSGQGETEIIKSPWLGSIGACFESYLSLYISSLDSSLRQLMDEFLLPSQPSPPPSPGGEEGVEEGEAGVLASCAELFVFYKKCLLQCAQLSTGAPMVELASLFASYLREYSSKVLSARLPQDTSAMVSLLRREDRSKLTDMRRLTGVLATADYCAETTARLHDKLRARVKPSLRNKVDLSREADNFRDVADACARELARSLESVSATAVDGVRSALPAADAVHKAIRPRVIALRARLSACRRYLLRILTLAVNSIGARYMRALLACHGMDSAVAEKLLQDAYNLKTFLLELPNLGTEVKRPVPSSYSRAVLQQFGKAEAILQLVLCGGGTPEVGWVGRLAAAVPGLATAELRAVLRLAAPKYSRAQVDALSAEYVRAGGDSDT